MLSAHRAFYLYSDGLSQRISFGGTHSENLTLRESHAQRISRSENFALVADAPRDALAVEEFEQRDGILARQPARDLFEDCNVNSGVD